MRILKHLCLTTLIVTSLAISGICRADTCYDPDGGYYFHCNVDPYGFPYEDDAVNFSFFIGGGNGHYHHHHGGGGHHGGGHGGHHH